VSLSASWHSTAAALTRSGDVPERWRSHVGACYAKSNASTRSPPPRVHVDVTAFGRRTGSSELPVPGPVPNVRGLRPRDPEYCSRPATFGATAHRRVLRIKEVLRRAEEQLHFQALCARDSGLPRSTSGTESALRCVLRQQNWRICRYFLEEKPSDGLEPSTPSLPSRPLATQFCLQIGLSEARGCVARRRACRF
jgi:hypothetical protein